MLSACLWYSSRTWLTWLTLDMPCNSHADTSDSDIVVEKKSNPEAAFGIFPVDDTAEVQEESEDITNSGRRTSDNLKSLEAAHASDEDIIVNWDGPDDPNNPRK